MPRQRITLPRIAAFNPPNGGYLWDEDMPRLAVRARPTGSKTFIFQGSFEGKDVRISIGGTDAWTIEAAREEARRLQRTIDNGHDPRDVIRHEKEARAAEEAARISEAEAMRIATEAKAEDARRLAELRQKYNLKALCTAYADGLRAKGKEKTARDVRSAFNVHIFEAAPDLAATPAREVTSRQIAAVIRKVREAGKDRTAGVLRNYLVAAYNTARRAPFDSGVSSELIAFDIENNPAEVVPAIPVARGDRTLSTAELRAYLAALDERPADQLLRLSLLSGGQRMAQMVRATVADLDADNGTLRLWDGKGKRASAREHLLPLGAKALALVKALAAERISPEERIFTIGERTAGNRLAQISAELGGKSFDLKDIRRTVETMLASMGISKDTRAQLLSHGISGVQAAHYDRHDYLHEKHAALEAWEARLTAIQENKKPTPNVLRLQSASAQ